MVSVQHRDPQSLVSLIGKAYRKRDGEETLQKLLATIDLRIKKVRIDPVTMRESMGIKSSWTLD